MKELKVLTRAISNLFYLLRYKWYDDSSCDREYVMENYFYTKDYMIHYRTDKYEEDCGFVGTVTIKMKEERFSEEDLQNSLNEIDDAIQRDLTFIKENIYSSPEVYFLNYLFIEDIDNKQKTETPWKSKFKYISSNEIKVFVSLLYYENIEQFTYYGLHLYLMGGMKRTKVLDKFEDIYDMLERGIKKENQYNEEKFGKLIEKEIEFYKEYSNFEKPDISIYGNRKDYYTEEEYSQWLKDEENFKKKRLDEDEDEDEDDDEDEAEDKDEYQSDFDELKYELIVKPTPKTKKLPKSI